MYCYEKEKPWLFTPEGIVMFCKMFQKANSLLGISGCCTIGKLISGFTGDSWHMLACVDRMIELGVLKEITKDRKDLMTQHRILVKA